MVKIVQTLRRGGGGGQVVSMLAFNSNDQSLNSAEVCSFNSEKLFEKNEKIKRDGHVPFGQKYFQTWSSARQSFY